METRETIYLIAAVVGIITGVIAIVEYLRRLGFIFTRRALLVLAWTGVGVAVVILIVAVMMMPRSGRTSPEAKPPVSTGPEDQGPEFLLADLKGPDKKDRLRALAFLKKLGPSAAKAVWALCEAADDPDPDVRKASVEALGRVGPESEEAQRKCWEFMNSKDRADHLSGRHALVEMAKANPKLRKEVAWRLHHDAAMGDISTIEPLAELVPESLGYLRTLTDHPNPAFGQKAREVLARVDK